MIALLFAALLLQTAPDAAAASAGKPASLQLGGLPKDDYGLVAWCHGAVAGQLELDPIVKADMEKIEGKAKVAARAASDAEMEKERRAFLKDYEHALAAAEAASPTYIHEKGVRAEERGYGMWTATRNKASIWRMLDWGMWDPNDVGCNDAAKRLFEKSKLFGEALKGSDKPDAAPEPAPPVAEAKPADVVAELKPESDGVKGETSQAAVDPQAGAPAPAASDKPAKTAKTTARSRKAPAKPKPNTVVADAKPAETPTPPAPTPDAPTPAEAGAKPAEEAASSPTPEAAPPAVVKTAKASTKKSKPSTVAKTKVTMGSSAEDIRDAIARGKTELATSKDDPASAPAPAPVATTSPDLRGPQ